MHNRAAVSFVASLVPIVVSVASRASIGDDIAHAGASSRYLSPTAVFNAYREGRDKRDWRKCFSCLAPKAQDDAVFEMFFECAESDSGEASAIRQKYGLDEAAITGALEKARNAKHGVGITRSGEGRPSAAPDRNLARDVVIARVKDKAEFYEAASNLFDRKGAVSPLGDLEELVVHGDTATGRARITIFHLESLGAGASRTVGDKVYRSFSFRRVNGGWLFGTPPKDGEEKAAPSAGEEKRGKVTASKSDKHGAGPNKSN